MKKYIILAELLVAMLFAFSTIIAQDNPIGNSSSEYFNPKTDIYMSNFIANVVEYKCIPAGSPNFLNNYACIGRFKNSGVRKDNYHLSSEIINKLVGYFKSQGYNDLIKIVNSYKADDATGVYRNYTEVEFKEMNAQILKIVVTLLSSFGKGEQYESHLERFFKKDMCRYGFVDVNGKIIIMPEYDNVGNFNDGLVRVEQKNLNGVEKAGFLNERGKVVIPLIYGKYSSNFSEGLCSVHNENGKKGYIDKTGKLVIPFQYDMAGDFKNGIAEVKKGEDKPWSKINKKGLLTTTKDNIKNKSNNNDDVLNNIAIGLLTESLKYNSEQSYSNTSKYNNSKSSENSKSGNSSQNNSSKSSGGRHTFNVTITWNNPNCGNCSFPRPSAQNGIVDYFYERSGSYSVKPVCPKCGKKQTNTISGFTENIGTRAQGSKVVSISCLGN